jgi:hypothetical protein
MASGCTSLGNTLAQELAWDRWQKCNTIPTVTLKEIRPDGQIWFTYTSPLGLAEAQACLRRAADEQGRAVAVVPPPPLTTSATGTAKEPLPETTALGEAPLWKVGDEWAFRWESPKGSGTGVWTVDREEMIDGVPYYVVKIGQWASFWRKADLAFHMDKHADVVVARYEPAQKRYSWPLATGKTWEQSYRRENWRDRQTSEVTMLCRVDSEETITVPAGTFATYKIVCRNKRTGSLIHETWYAPEVRNWVRERGQFPYGIRARELIAVKLR